MSSKFYLGIGLLAALLAGSLWICHSINKMQQPVNDQLNIAIRQAEAGDLSQAVSTLNQAQTHWADHRNALASFSNHTPMDDIDILFAETIRYGRNGQPAEFLAGCEQLTLLLTSIGDDHRLTWWNLLSAGISPTPSP